jgi:hypothetical protein
MISFGERLVDAWQSMVRIKGEYLLEMINEVLKKARIRGISHHA